MRSVLRLNHLNINRQRGISNIQIMIGVLISAIMIAGSMSMFHMIDQAKIDNDLRDLTDYKKKTVALWAQHGSLVGVTQETLIDMNFFASGDVSGAVGSRTIKSRWAGTVQVSVAGFYVVGDTLRFDYTGVPTSACKQLAMQAGMSADGVMVEGTWIKTTVAFGDTGRPNEPALVSLCDASNNKATLSYFITKN